MSLNNLDYWRLHDDLSVIDAAILITGNDPSEVFNVCDNRGDAERDSNGLHLTAQRRDYEGYSAVFKALRMAILSDKLRATVGFRARDPVSISGDFYVSGERVHFRRELDADGDEVLVEFDTLVRAGGFSASIFTNRRLSTLKNATKLYVLQEPAWDETTVQVDDLKEWLSAKGLAPEFFFPQGRPEGFRDTKHPRYSAKLACAVAAWEAVKAPKPNASVKATVEEWVRANAVLFGMVGDDGVPTNKAVGEVSAVVNWNTSGGAVATYTGATAPAKETLENIANFSTAYDPSEDQIPF